MTRRTDNYRCKSNAKVSNAHLVACSRVCRRCSGVRASQECTQGEVVDMADIISITRTVGHGKTNRDISHAEVAKQGKP